MSERTQDDATKGDRGHRGEGNEALQNELRREASEGRDSIGDVGENRNLSGSSTWETIVDGSARPERGESGEVL